jgi:hypothetical protein
MAGGASCPRGSGSLVLPVAAPALSWRALQPSELVLTQPRCESYHSHIGPEAKKNGHSRMNLSVPVATRNQPPSVALAADELARLVDSPLDHSKIALQ